MNIHKVSLQNNSFGFHLGPNITAHFNYTARRLNQVAEGNLLKDIIDGHSDNTRFIQESCPDKTIELVSYTPVRKICEYEIYDSNNRKIASIVTNHDNLWYGQLVRKLKDFQKKHKNLT